MYAPAPPLTTEQDHRNLTGRKVLIAHERTKTLTPSWYMGRIKLFGVSPAWKKVVLVRQLPRQVHQEGDGQRAGRRLGA